MTRSRRLTVAGVSLFLVCVGIAFLLIREDHLRDVREKADDITDLTVFSNMMRMIAKASEDNDLSAVRMGAQMLLSSGVTEAFPPSERESVCSFLCAAISGEISAVEDAATARRWSAIGIYRALGHPYAELLSRCSSRLDTTRASLPSFAGNDALTRKMLRQLTGFGHRSLISPTRHGADGSAAFCGNTYLYRDGDTIREWVFLPLVVLGSSENGVDDLDETAFRSAVDVFLREQETENVSLALWYQDENTVFYSCMTENGKEILIGVDKGSANVCYVSERAAQKR